MSRVSGIYNRNSGAAKSLSDWAIKLLLRQSLKDRNLRRLVPSPLLARAPRVLARAFVPLDKVRV